MWGDIRMIYKHICHFYLTFTDAMLNSKVYHVTGDEWHYLRRLPISYAEQKSIKFHVVLKFRIHILHLIHLVMLQHCWLCKRLKGQDPSHYILGYPEQQVKEKKKWIKLLLHIVHQLKEIVTISTISLIAFFSGHQHGKTMKKGYYWINIYK